MNRLAPPQPGPTRRDPAPRVLAFVSIMVVAANLRPTITAVGPLLGEIGGDLGLSAARLGLLGAVPLVAFAVVSPLVHRLSDRIGADRAVFVATLVLVVGTVLRSLPGGQATLWTGTALLGAAIAVSNVTVPAIVKRDYPSEVPFVTGVYSAVLSTTAALASGLALPVGTLGGWRLGVGVWAAVSVLAALVWLPRLRRTPVVTAVAAPVEARDRTVWSSVVAWQVTLFMATQATTFYLLVTWLPTIEASHGVDPVAAGWHLFLYQVAGIVAGLAVTVFMRGRADHRMVGVVVSLTLVAAVAGLLLVPSASLVWILLAGLSGGSSLVVALALVGERSRTAGDAARLSGMVQSVGYLLAVAGPLGAGLLFQLTGSWSYPLLAVAAVALVQLVVSLLAGRDRFV